jgi:protein TonB
MEETQRQPATTPAENGRIGGARVIDLTVASLSAEPREVANPSSGKTDAGKVVVLDEVRRRPAGPDPSALRIDLGERPATPSPAATSWLALFIAASLIAHAGLLLLVDFEPEPLPSVGVVSLSVELVVGADLAAGQAVMPSPTESAVEAPPASTATEPAADVVREDVPRAGGAPAWVEHVLTLQPPPQPAPDNGAGASAQTAPEAIAPSDSLPRPADANGQQAAMPLAGTASSGIGRGASNADLTYPGIVAARLARFKQYPPEAHARGNQGTATVTFTVEGNGSVSQIALTKKSGFASLDRESQAMVRRAAPFPPTPTGDAMSFTVPVDFKIR